MNTNLNIIIVVLVLSVVTFFMYNVYVTVDHAVTTINKSLTIGK